MFQGNWREQLTTGRQQFHYVFQNNLFSDVKFVVGNEKTPVYSHSLVLKIRSSVFEKLLDKLHGPNREIFIEGVTPEGFKRFIQFLYIDQLEATANEALEILPLAKKYRVSALTAQCVALLKEGLGESNAASIYQKARELKEIELEQKSIQFIQNNAGQVFAGEDYKNLSFENLYQLLKLDKLDISEINLFEALIEWAKEECARHTLRPTPKHIRMMIKDALFLMRFPVMSLEDFNNRVRTQEILNEKETTEILKYLEADVASKAYVMPTTFNATKRNLLNEDEIDLSNVNDETHKQLAKIAVMKSNPSGENITVIVTNLVLQIEPKDSSVELEDLKAEILKIKKFGLFWGVSNEIKMPTGQRKLLLSFAADVRRSYGVGTIVEAVLDLENYVAEAFVNGYKDEIVVRL